MSIERKNRGQDDSNLNPALFAVLRYGAMKCFASKLHKYQAINIPTIAFGNLTGEAAMSDLKSTRQLKNGTCRALAFHGVRRRFCCCDTPKRRSRDGRNKSY
jgi:hypothetical protein